MVTQIAGLLARRIVSWTDLDSELERGQLYGMIKFGSCTELYMDKNVELFVEKVNILQVVTLLSGGYVMNKSIIPNLFTSANLAFGVLGYHILCNRNTFYAAICVLLSLVADGLDGRVARALGVAGPMGRELDSLSDVVGFGVAPAYMLYMKELYGLGWIAYVPLLVFAVLGAFRLARFNIKTDGSYMVTLKDYQFQLQVVWRQRTYCVAYRCLNLYW